MCLAYLTCSKTLCTHGIHYLYLEQLNSLFLLKLVAHLISK